MKDKKPKDIIEMIEKEIYLSTGVKTKKHWSKKCLMNDIIWEIQKQIKQAYKEGYNDCLRGMGVPEKVIKKHK